MEGAARLFSEVVRGEGGGLVGLVRVRILGRSVKVVSILTPSVKTKVLCFRIGYRPVQ